MPERNDHSVEMPNCCGAFCMYDKLAPSSRRKSKIDLEERFLNNYFLEIGKTTAEKRNIKIWL